MATLPMAAGCVENQTSRVLPRGDDAYQALAARAASVEAPVDYRIGALDTIDVAVFAEPDLSVKGVQVDAAGNVELPLIGTVPAAGSTARQLSDRVGRLYGARYLEHPQVTVSVATAVSQRVTVQGEVTEPGVYDLKGTTTLLQAISLAKGETRVAALRSVSVFRVVEGTRVGAIFDIAAIRRGEQPDPALVGNDMVIVGYSAGKGAWRDTLAAAPLLNVFAFNALR
ncbi:polysaccharide export outer membrane protein [Sphingomonas jinjuensis]|uniref:Polysaccharide export outer membrane protein n=2 Tax=Sphingomonas jinjuensis TaxID=535907 RepID=A0A840FCC5_9SPHN|nr:polysaccharide export outer membrane protein [Sphingomonas jinjuensis]